MHRQGYTISEVKRFPWSVATFTSEIKQPLTRCSRVALSVHALSSAHLQHVILNAIKQSISLFVLLSSTGPPAATQRESWLSPSRCCGLCVELELRDDATTGIMLFNAHSFSDDHCCRYITRRLCLARAQPRRPLSHLQLHARPVSAHGLPKRTPLDTREFDRPAGALPRPKCRVL